MPLHLFVFFSFSLAYKGTGRLYPCAETQVWIVVGRFTNGILFCCMPREGARWSFQVERER